jgi:hypothetical protein
MGLREYLDSYTLPGTGPAEEEIEQEIEEGMALCSVLRVAAFPFKRRAGSSTSRW